ncbi:LOW QUALITY PROTEIN: Serine/threonine protein kinase [Phytophthora megakarya]|uniref:Serine/threonine protein kinase n=1 Tax=Phytophthora megakarya TaxID=4795 RepID=A0A225V1N7_9STRA|nr:LOW QUALITY PROTEIN: Serine/threonine protein kinase [Phytophthora megakarya]
MVAQHLSSKTVTVATEKENRTIHREAYIWYHARHQHIAPFFGACDEGSTERSIAHRSYVEPEIEVSKGCEFLVNEQNGDKDGANRWKAPEVIGKGKPGAQSNVYSLCMCVVEAVSSDISWCGNMPHVAVKFHVTRKQFSGFYIQSFREGATLTQNYFNI